LIIKTSRVLKTRSSIKTTRIMFKFSVPEILCPFLGIFSSMFVPFDTLTCLTCSNLTVKPFDNNHDKNNGWNLSLFVIFQPFQHTDEYPNYFKAIGMSSVSKDEQIQTSLFYSNALFCKMVNLRLVCIQAVYFNELLLACFCWNT